MEVKILILVLMVIFIISSTILLIELSNLLAEPIEFEIFSRDFLDEEDNLEFDLNESSDDALQFYPNMRFSYNSISYFIDDSCDAEKIQRIEEAFEYLEEEIVILEFYKDLTEPNIKVKCNESLMREYETIGRKKHFIVGEGGPTSVIKTDLFHVIEEGVIFLFYDERICDFPIIELHELLHVFGFQHSSNKKSIMYPIASCNQILTTEIKNELKRLYQTEPLPDLTFSDISAIKQGTYLDFEVKIINQGLVSSEEIFLVLYTLPEKKEIKKFDFETINYGAGKSLKVENLKLPLRTKEIGFEILSGEELNYKNNVVEMSLLSD